MNSDHRVDALVRDSLAASQENLHSVEKSTVSHSQERTENGTGLTRGTLQNESQELEMQGHHLEAVITHPYNPYHLPECELATGVYDDRADCICFRLRACEQRNYRQWDADVAEAFVDGEAYGYRLGLEDAEAAASELVVDFQISDYAVGVSMGAMRTRDAIRALKEKQ